MRREITETGWNEVTTKRIVITKIVTGFSGGEDWINFNDRHEGGLARGRKVCHSCGSKWTSNNSDISLAMCNIGNKCICETCVDHFKSKGIEILKYKKS